LKHFDQHCLPCEFAAPYCFHVTVLFFRTVTKPSCLYWKFITTVR